MDWRFETVRSILQQVYMQSNIKHAWSLQSQTKLQSDIYWGLLVRYNDVETLWDFIG